MPKTKKKSARSKKIKVFVISCHETDINGLHISSEQGVGDFIEGDMGNSPDEKEFNYTIKVKMMTARQYNNLPEHDF